MRFNSFKDLVAFIQKRFYFDYSDAFTAAYELVVSSSILWDTGFNGYVWPNTLTEEDIYDVLDIGLEKETSPF